GGGDEIAKVWSMGRRTKLVERLATIGPYAAGDASRIAAVLDDASTHWAGAHDEACRARDRGELTPQLYERDLACLARTRAAIAAVADVFEGTTLEHVPDAVAAVRELPEADGCRTEAETSTVPPPPAAIATRTGDVAAEIARARVLARALTSDAITYAQTTAAHASEVGYLPLVARAQLELGRARVLQNDGPAAIEPLQRAGTSGFEAGDLAVAVEAYALEIHQIASVASPSDRPANADARLAAMPIFESVAKGLGPTGTLARAVLYNNIGTVQLIAGDRAKARDAFTRAYDALRPGVGDTERPEIEQNLALATDDPVVREKLSASAIAELARQLGPDHPSVLVMRATDAMFLGNPEKARAALRGTCRRFAELHPHLATKAVTCWFELGWLAEEQGDVAEARTAMAAVTAAGPSAGVKGAIAGGYLEIFDGDSAAGVTSLLATADSLLANPQQATRLRGVTALIAAATHQTIGDAIATWRRAESALGELTTLTHLTIYQRYLARTRARIAILTRAAEPAAAAARWYRVAGGYDALATELEAIAAGSR
ncbi:MAG TPA: hypothetical protein VGO00_14255, partial [Kofleriaceae bacterium]|nr:hypothetical protein [Kofleriaceae bacterium]